METKKILTILVLALGLMVCSIKVSEAGPMGTAFTYQGRLIDANSAADGLYDFVFKLFDDANTVTGNQLGSTIGINDLDVIDGYFTVELDFGSDVFDGDAVWLETRVAHADGSDPCTLRPRQEITAVPYALQTRGMFVDNAGNVGIGTTAPTQKLDVAGNIAVSGTADVAANIAVGGTVDGVDLSAHAASTNAHHTPPTALPPSGPASGDLSGNYPNPSVVNDSHTHGNGTVSDNITIDNGLLYAPAGAGNVGIGTTSPGYKLTVTTYEPTGRGVYGSASNSGDYTNYGGYFKAAGKYGQGVYGYATGSVGPGVHGEASGSTGMGVYGQASATSGTNFGVYGKTSSSAGYAGFFVGGRNYFAGDVGIGTASPAEKLEVSGNLKVSGTGNGLIFPDGTKLTTAVTAGGLTLPYAGSTSTTGNAFSVSNTGSGKGVHGRALGSSYGVFGEATASSGLNFGVYGKTNSPHGYAGYFVGRVKATKGVEMPLTYYEVTASATERTVTTAVHNFCALTKVKLQTGDAGTNKWCEVVRNPNGTWTLKARGGSGASVTAGCQCF